MTKFSLLLVACLAIQSGSVRAQLGDAAGAAAGAVGAAADAAAGAVGDAAGAAAGAASGAVGAAGDAAAGAAGAAGAAASTATDAAGAGAGAAGVASGMTGGVPSQGGLSVSGAAGPVTSGALGVAEPSRFMEGGESSGEVERTLGVRFRTLDPWQVAQDFNFLPPSGQTQVLSRCKGVLATPRKFGREVVGICQVVARR